MNPPPTLLEASEPPAVVLHVKPAVLGFTSFVDAHSRGEFQAGEHVDGLLRRELTGVLKDAILPVPNAKLIALRLKVNVARAGIQGVHEDGVDDADRMGHRITAHVTRGALLAKNKSKSAVGAEVGL